MDDFEEKKWFIYLTDHHEGPFSLSDLNQRMEKGEITTNSYLWVEGMPDWKVMTEIPACAPLYASKNTAAPPPRDAPSIDPTQFEELTSLRQNQTANASPGHTSHDTIEENGSKTEMRSDSIRENHEVDGPGSTQKSEAPAVVIENSPVIFARESKARARIENDSPAKAASPISAGRIIFFTILLFTAGLTTAYFQGSLDPVLKNPAVSAITDSIAAALQPISLSLASKYPSLTRWFSPIPSLEDLSKTDYEELRTAASAQLDKDGPKIAFALSTQDLSYPRFYIASNMPDGTQITLRIEGISDTLLNQLSVSASVDLVVSKKLAKSSPIRWEQEQALPRGEYEVYAFESEKQPPDTAALLIGLQPLAGAKLPPGISTPVKLLATKAVFLGGAKDSTYAARLKEYHDKLQQKASTELAEIKQFTLSIENSLGETNSKFKALYKPGKHAPAKKKTWDEFHNRWSTFQTQISTAFSKWTPEALERDFFYGNLYKLLQQLDQNVRGLHDIQHSYFAGNITDASAFDIKVGQTTSMTDSSLAALKVKIEQAEKLSPTPNGMPRRDGL